MLPTDTLVLLVDADGTLKFRKVTGGSDVIKIKILVEGMAVRVLNLAPNTDSSAHVDLAEAVASELQFVGLVYVGHVNDRQGVTVHVSRLTVAPAPMLAKTIIILGTLVAPKVVGRYAPQSI
jgi:hypothetical protein